MTATATSSRATTRPSSCCAFRAAAAAAAEAAEAAKEMELRAVKAEARLEIAAAATKELLAANEALQGAKQGKAPGPIAKALSTIPSPGRRHL
mmetsp:Transcript_45071/g.146427  ORF Transcript_45071/g.146427 Transcript_45071/m.146427 type:complete len:93 (-) Transcript_45071:235-513(-)